MKKQQIIILVALLTVVLSVSACGCFSGAKRREHRTQAEVNKEKVKLSEQYQKCMKKAGADEEKQAKCEQYLKAAEALK